MKYICSVNDIVLVDGDKDKVLSFFSNFYMKTYRERGIQVNKDAAYQLTGTFRAHVSSMRSQMKKFIYEGYKCQIIQVK